ncbi:MAG TPA: hypothetical protein VEV81_06530 [Pyrinomonadaceae bacterium]|nr:hypothetical protein [Pyrinomonadaceae bacterium]
MRTRQIVLVVLCLSALLLTGCQRVGSTTQGEGAGTNGLRGKSNAYVSPARLADLEDRAVAESSGIVASRRNPDVFWTHNDSGDGPIIYAFDRKGRSRGRWHVTDAQAVDWEDIAAGPGPRAGVSYLYIGDIGDNDTRRDYVTVYRVPEPETADDDGSAPVGGKHVTEPSEALRLKYPDGRHNAETLMVHPKTGDLYIITKDFTSATGVYKLKAPFTTTGINTLTRVGEISVPNIVGGLITGGDISPDGRKIILCDYLSGYEVSLPDDAKDDFDQIWKEPMVTVELGPRRQGETVCYSLDGDSILATSEKRPVPLIEVKRKRG